MSKARIFVEMPLVRGEELMLAAAPANHMVSVLRLQEGARVVLFNGEGGEYHGCLTSVKRKAVSVKLDTFIDDNKASSLRVHLGQVMIKGDRMDYALQKATELGVAEITPLISERCEVRLKGDRMLKKVSHWQRVVQSACEQCKSNLVPKVNTPQAVQSWLSVREESLRWVCHPLFDKEVLEEEEIEREEIDGQGRAEGIRSAALLIGAEGGLTEDEVQEACANQFTAQLFGPRVLRAETAPIVALSLLQMRYGDF